MLEPFCTLPLPKWHQILAFALLAAQIAAAMPVTSQSIRPEIPTTPTGDANGLSTLAERINGTCFRSLEPTQVLNNSTIKENGEEVEPPFAAEPSVPKVEALNSSVPHGVYSYLEGSGYKIADSIANTRANHTLTYVGDALERPVPATTNAEEPAPYS
ncbi:hypothetical protein BC834DRAFT_969705 [Gloeopeniophorella convolvens]|nr:hypothetical protein BC834DRAFT_969705 [Gloeopeniophorella convolvens]